MFTVMPSYRY